MPQFLFFHFFILDSSMMKVVMKQIKCIDVQEGRVCYGIEFGGQNCNWCQLASAV